MPSDPVLTLDIDCAPDFAIDYAAKILLEHRVRATWFVTHSSPAIDRLRQHNDLFELGIHPNFLAGSTHGDSLAAVLSHCMRLVPEATSVRTHSLVQSTPILSRIAAETPVCADVSLFLPRTPHLRPVAHEFNGHPLVRIPYVWEDDDEMEVRSPSWRLDSVLQLGHGLKILDFHPMHVFLNSSTLAPYTQLKQRCTSLSLVSQGRAEEAAWDGDGTRTFPGSVVMRRRAGQY